MPNANSVVDEVSTPVKRVKFKIALDILNKACTDTEKSIKLFTICDPQNGYDLMDIEDFFYLIFFLICVVVNLK